jgi:hypothetical protein
MTHRYFGDWYRSAGVPPENIPLEKRWAAIEAFTVDAADAASLTQVFYGLAPSNTSFAERFRTAFNKADANFAMSGNDREMLVLAGAALVHVMENGVREIADLSGLCLVSAAFQNVRTAGVPQIPELAAVYLSKRCANRAALADGSPESNLLTALTDAGEPYSELAPEFQKMQSEFPIIAEETNMLWWLFSETSGDLQQRFSVLPVGAACLVTGKELADLTRIIPGPIAARAFLDKAVRSGRKKVPTSVSVTDVVNDAPKAWRTDHYAKPLPNELSSILPLNQAVRLSVQAPNDNTWRPMFQTATGISATAEKAPNAFAYQVFLEHLAARSFVALKES